MRDEATRYPVHVLGTFATTAAIGMALGFLFGVGCASAVLYTVWLSGYRAALRDAADGGTGARYREQTRRMQQR